MAEMNGNNSCARMYSYVPFLTYMYIYVDVSMCEFCKRHRMIRRYYLEVPRTHETEATGCTYF